MFARVGGSRYLPNADSPAREKHARLIAVGMVVEYALKHLHRYSRPLVSRDVRGMSFHAGVSEFFPLFGRFGTSKIYLSYHGFFFSRDNQSLEYHVNIVSIRL